MSSTLDSDDTIQSVGGRKYQDVVNRAHRRWKKCHQWEQSARTHWLEDLRFVNGDVYNNWQWPSEVYRDRGSRPSLTVNETRVRNLHIINEAKQNKSSVKYRPTGGGATQAAAEVYEGMYRSIANVSNAQMAQGTAIELQVDAGLGYTIIETRYVSPDPTPGPEAMDQEIIISSVKNPMGVMLDCDCEEPDGTGARYGFMFSDRPKDEVIEEYPELENRLTVANSVDGADAGWIRDDHVRECRYYEVKEDKDELVCDDEGVTIYRSDVPAKLFRQWEDDAEAEGKKLRRRDVIRKSVKCYLIIGNDVVGEPDDLPGTCVPIVPWNGRITLIDKRLDRVSHTRGMIDAQRMLNYNWSASVEYGALQSKSPWLVPAATISDYKSYYETANVVNHAFLPYKHIDEDGKEIPAPTKMQPPTAAPVYMEGVQLAQQFMQSASGQYEATMGQPGNERSGRAINERQRQGDRATYHFLDNQALAIRRQGVIVKEWIPIIYDTERTARIINAKDEEEEVQINPTSPEAHREKKIGDAIQRIFNPNIGSYEVVSDVGPDWGTQRQEAFNAIVQILTQAPELINKIGDLLFKVADFPLADEMAERLKPDAVSPEAKQAIDQLQKTLQLAQAKGMNTEKLLAEAMQALSEERLRVKAKDSDATIDAFDADTKRLAVVKDMIPMEPDAMRLLVMQTVKQALQDNLGPIVASLRGGLEQSTSAEGPPGATGALPVHVPDVGQQAAQPGGM